MKKLICPVWFAGFLDNVVRRWLHNPEKILKDYIQEGMNVLDFGCGPGFFTLDMAVMVGDSGKVIAADMQQGMLDKLRKKLKGKEIEKRVTLHCTSADKIGIDTKVDFILACYVIHELENKENILKEMALLMKPNGLLYIIEPLMHVPKKEFQDTVNKCLANGFKLIKEPKVALSRAVLLTR